MRRRPTFSEAHNRKQPRLTLPRYRAQEKLNTLNYISARSTLLTDAPIPNIDFSPIPSDLPLPPPRAALRQTLSAAPLPRAWTVYTPKRRGDPDRPLPTKSERTDLFTELRRQDTSTHLPRAWESYSPMRRVRDTRSAAADRFVTAPTPVVNLSKTQAPQVAENISLRGTWGREVRDLALDVSAGMVQGGVWLGGKLGKAALDAAGGVAKLAWRKAVMEALFPEEEEADPWHRPQEDSGDEWQGAEPEDRSAPSSSRKEAPRVIDASELRRLQDLHDKIQPKVYEVTGLNPKVSRRMFRIREALQRGELATAKHLTSSLERLADLFGVA
jgi:hypothetical protein